MLASSSIQSQRAVQTQIQSPVMVQNETICFGLTTRWQIYSVHWRTHWFQPLLCPVRVRVGARVRNRCQLGRSQGCDEFFILPSGPRWRKCVGLLTYTHILPYTHPNTGSGLTASTRKNAYMLTLCLTLDTQFSVDVDVDVGMYWTKSQMTNYFAVLGGLNPPCWGRRSYNKVYSKHALTHCRTRPMWTINYPWILQIWIVTVSRVYDKRNCWLPIFVARSSNTPMNICGFCIWILYEISVLVWSDC